MLPDIDMSLSLDTSVRIEFDVGVEMGTGGRLPDYEGEYTVTPRLVEQILPTNGRSMNDDVTVEAIGVDRVSNPSGGKTVTIGMD